MFASFAGASIPVEAGKAGFNCAPAQPGDDLIHASPRRLAHLAKITTRALHPLAIETRAAPRSHRDVEPPNTGSGPSQI